MSRTTGIVVRKAVDQDLPEILTLWGKNRKNLGFLPKDGFQGRLESKQILVADLEGAFAGYLLFFTNLKDVARITHLCVSPAAEGRGVGRSLVEQLLAETSHLRRVSLQSRRDLKAWHFWPKVGFVSAGESIGRGRDRHPLTRYVYEHKHTALWDHQETERLVDVAIDANVLFDLIDENREQSEESLGLLADWLTDQIRLVVTEEMANEVSRCPDDVKRREFHRQLQEFPTIVSDPARFQEVLRELPGLMGPARQKNDQSDQRQLARAIASNTTAFVTRDQGLLKHEEELYRRYGLRILRPAELICQHNMLRSDQEYQPALLNGTRLVHRPFVHSADSISQLFYDPGLDRSSTDLRDKLHRWMANPEATRVTVVHEKRDSDSVPEMDPLALLGLEKRGPCRIRVLLMRVAKRLSGTRRQETLLRCLIMTCINRALAAGVNVLEVRYGAVSEADHHVLIDYGFVRVTSGLLKLLCPMVGTPQEAIDHINRLGFLADSEKNDCSEIFDTLAGRSIGDPDVALLVERKLWPIKLLDCHVRNYVVPIQPRWAKHLIGGGLSDGDLFGADQDLAFNSASVYYRAARGSLTAPGRVLWYVSEDKDFPASKAIVAASLLDSVRKGSALELYRENRRFGVYWFDDVQRLAENKRTDHVMALRFGYTEQLKRPARYAVIQSILKQTGRGNSFQGPVAIAEDVFAQIYRLGNAVDSTQT